MKRQLEDLIRELKKYGIREDILDGFRIVKREYFVENKDDAYLNEALPFLGQTTSQPLIIAEIIQALELNEDDIVLEAGTGSGFQTCLLALFSKKIYSFEIDHLILKKAKENIQNFINTQPQIKSLKEKITLINSNILSSENFINSIFKKEGKIDKCLFSFAITKVPNFILKLVNVTIAPIDEGQEYQTLKKFVKKEDKILVYSLGKVSFVKVRGGNYDKNN
jgi:protein-L-isoaspartate(D-aspartate) O-methyltransferase